MSSVGIIQRDPAQVNRIESSIEVGNLASEILNPERDHAVVCVTMPTWASEPLVDVVSLAAALSGAARVYVLRTGDLSWDLGDRLPPRLDVYGGATRVWWPLTSAGLDPLAHPLFFTRDRSDSETTIQSITTAFQARGLLITEAPRAGSELAGVVTRVLSHGAELTLTGGIDAFAHASHLTRQRDLSPAQVVRVGQPVRARVAGGGTGRRIPVSLLPFEPDPWRRFRDEHEEGMLVEGVVAEFRNFGAFIDIFPGVRGLLHRSQISHEWVSHAEDFLEIGEPVVVRLSRIDPESQQLDLSLLEIPDDADVRAPASIYPDGPPWLDASEVTEPPAAALEQLEEPWAADEHAERIAPAPTGASPSEPTPDADAVDDHLAVTAETETRSALDDQPPSVVTEPEHAPRAESDEEEPAEPTSPREAVGDGGAAKEIAAVAEETDRLERAILDGRELQRQVSGLFAGAQRRMEELRAEARQLGQILERDLAEARLRVLEFAERETRELAGSTEEALTQARGNAEELRERLAAAEEDRCELRQRLSQERERVGAGERRADRLTKELRTERTRADRLERALHAYEPDPGRRLLDEIRLAWERTTAPADRERFPWREPLVGPELLDSMERVQGISRDRVVEVCAHVACGRAPEIASLELHQFRAGDAGTAPQRERGDGARAWRCSLQTGTAAARRLHFWLLLDGRVELAKIAYHDDYSIR